jgi:hypothetical protein
MKKTELFLGLLAISLGIGLWVLSKQTAEPVAIAQPPRRPPHQARETVVQLTSVSFAPPKSKGSTVQSPSTADLSQPTNTAPELQDQEAREALALVGADDDADAYWLDAIFDSSLPDREREDLIEDLNEAGFDDPKNVTADDLPLIMNRLELIDAALPDADEFMTPHLLEAQKDLIAMLAKAAPQQ